MRVHTRFLAPLFILCLFRMSAIFAGVSVVDADARYPEGPLWDQGRLLYVEYAGDGIKSWDGKQSKIFWHKDHCGANALIHFRDGHILVACYDGNYLLELDAHGKEVRAISKDSSGKRFTGPNDFTTDGHGGIYFSASGVYDIKAPITGAVLHLSADGREVREVCKHPALFKWIDCVEGRAASARRRDAGRQNPLLSHTERWDFGASSRVGAAGRPRASHSTRGCLQRSGWTETGSRWQLLHRAERVRPCARRERRQKVSADNRSADALRYQCRLRPPGSCHGVYHRGIRAMETAVSRCRISMDGMSRHIVRPYTERGATTPSRCRIPHTMHRTPAS